MDPLAPVSVPAPPSASTTGSSQQQTPSEASAQAFQRAMAYALNPPNVLSDAAGDDDDDDDGSALKVGNSMTF